MTDLDIEALPGERWLPVVGYEEHYLVSDFGRVYVMPRDVYCGHAGAAPIRRPGRLLKPNPVGSRRTHLAVRLTDAAGARDRKVHHLVIEAFVGPCPDGLMVLHWDDDPRNNRVENLRYGTARDNQLDLIRNGKNHYRNRTHCAQGHEFTPENVYRPPSRPSKRMCRTCIRDRSRNATKKGTAA